MPIERIIKLPAFNATHKHINGFDLMQISNDLFVDEFAEYHGAGVVLAELDLD